ncbi:hypothetical protein HER10_EVM0000484 [Colletotrichum scovillei]|uniref:uncharacterized protein n=1 Tax=Colletotrichum scovillei TaxID=1209932 RepID=UPI0015C3FD1E|nr:uncharacterized protein HER10_EVM0000484 [Colletotrichum scovillei]KAF4782563.1 hypothetical protein HER10_EVM0000484 [Colletotrichum scovillei]
MSESTVTDQGKAINDQAKNLKDAHTAIRERDEELQATKLTMENQQKRICEQEARLKDASDTLRAKTEHIDSMRKALDAAHSEKLHDKAKLEDVRRQLRQKSTALDQSSKDLARARDDKTSLQAQLEDLRQDVVDVRQDIEGREAREGITRLRWLEFLGGDRMLWGSFVSRIQDGKPVATLTEYQPWILFATWDGSAVEQEMSGSSIASLTIQVLSVLDQGRPLRTSLATPMRRLAKYLAQTNSICPSAMRLLIDACRDRAFQMPSSDDKQIFITHIDTVADVLAARWEVLRDLAPGPDSTLEAIKGFTSSGVLPDQWSHDVGFVDVPRGEAMVRLVKGQLWSLGIAWEVSTKRFWFMTQDCVRKTATWEFELRAPKAAGENIAILLAQEASVCVWWVQYGW